MISWRLVRNNLNWFKENTVPNIDRHDDQKISKTEILEDNNKMIIDINMGNVILENVDFKLRDDELEIKVYRINNVGKSIDCLFFKNLALPVKIDTTTARVSIMPGNLHVEASILEYGEIQ